LKNARKHPFTHQIQLQNITIEAASHFMKNPVVVSKFSLLRLGSSELVRFVGRMPNASSSVICMVICWEWIMME
jgi:hypothetical protein